MSSAWKTALCCLALVLALSRCDDQVAGTSVGTGNPTEIEIAFKDDAGTAPITGSLTVYASTQIPVVGYAPEPLLKVDVAGASQATLRAADFAALPDSLWPKGSKNGSDRFFNVVVTGLDRGAVLKGFTWRKTDTSFGLRAQDVQVKAGEAKAIVNGRLAPLVALQGTMDTANLNIFGNYYLFIYGTAFQAQIVHGNFSIAKVPKDIYEGFVLSLPLFDRVISGMDSTSVFSLSPSLAEGELDLTKGPLHDRVLLPDSLRIL
ncbi:MAG: hypothetical protein ABIW76_12910 [Fibrobacteria bacterium]